MNEANDLTKLKDQVGPWLDRHARPGWKPAFGPPRQGRGFSWYGGQQAGPEPNSAPTCGECNTPMGLVLGLDLGSLPKDLGHPLNSGVIEVYYCDSFGECEVETWEPYSAGHRVHLVPAYDWEQAPLTGHRTIMNWSKTTDRPDHPDLIALGAEITFDKEDFRFAVPSEGIDVAGIGYGEHLDDIIGTPAQGDKLGGWPNWVQYREHASCRECGEEMVYLYQLDDNGPHGLMFGDAGCAYVSYCRTHPDVMTLLWQCH